MDTRYAIWTAQNLKKKKKKKKKKQETHHSEESFFSLRDAEKQMNESSNIAI